MEFIPLQYHNADQWIGGILGIIAGFIVQGEMQIYFVLLFQNFAEREKVTYDLNPFHHIDPTSLPVILFTGWGWGKKRVEAPPYFPQKRMALCMIHMMAPIANLMLVGTLGSIYLFLHSSILKFAIEINALIAMANFLIPIPPMALGRAVSILFPALEGRRATLERSGALLLTVLVILDYGAKTGFFQSILMPATRFISHLILAV
jgi:hypothetical protein